MKRIHEAGAATPTKLIRSITKLCGRLQHADVIGKMRQAPVGKVVNLGYFILPEHWGKGIVTEAAKEVIRFAFEEVGVIKVEAGCIKENIASE